MIVEWIRRTDNRFSKELKGYVFTDAPLTDLEKNHPSGS